MTCPFCAIVAEEEEAEVLDETAKTLAFAPLEPVSEGHLLVIPKAHHENLFDIPDSTFRTVVTHAKTIAERLRDDEFDGVNVLHASGEAAQQSVPHFHLHVAPRRSTDGLDLWPDSGYEASDSDGSYEAVKAALEGNSQ
ncbi:HIT domain-containing protein [Natronobacterium texcoconense]|uniref:Histidine triad (HIT) family protein n=1 Tax=Natronobacterium texcoconense TaxID=1095778 RepID=A0A1H0ZG97_NATTX|nr:HIT domain-containing protein [Natronobacterium texcoconense]SDQ26535.1 histidine triad (HIT) family protein [Natronobacterium texcoconense]